LGYRNGVRLARVRERVRVRVGIEEGERMRE
jgi:hypothetical protein